MGMRGEALNRLIEDSLTNVDLNTRLENANRELERHKQELAESVLGEYDLTADEREAVISKDLTELMALGVSKRLLIRAEWCTGD